MTPLGIAAALYFLLSRVAYAGGVGIMLTRERRDRAFTRTAGVDVGYRRFKRIASVLMNNDGVAFVALAVVTTGSLDAPWPAWLRLTAGAALCVAGVGTKVWAARLLGSHGYHWRNFFAPQLEHEVTAAGPYRWLRNPMYTVGYLQTYGLALILESWPALIGAAFAQAAILTFYFVVEKPHFEQLGQPETVGSRRVRETQARRMTGGRRPA